MSLELLKLDIVLTVREVSFEPIQNLGRKTESVRNFDFDMQVLWQNVS